MESTQDKEQHEQIMSISITEKNNIKNESKTYKILQNKFRVETSVKYCKNV